MYKVQYVREWYWVGLTPGRGCRSREEGSSRLLVWKGYTDMKGPDSDPWNATEAYFLREKLPVREDSFEPGIGTKQ